MRGKTASPETRRKIGEKSRAAVRTPEWRARISESQRGEKGNNWRGGRIVREGRVLIYVGRDHPMADQYGYVYEHRLVAAQKLGRALTRRDAVHHIDLDPANNHPDNIVVLTPNEHITLHSRFIRSAGLSPVDALAAVLALRK